MEGRSPKLEALTPAAGSIEPHALAASHDTIATHPLDAELGPHDARVSHRAVSDTVLQAARFMQHPNAAGMRDEDVRAFLRSKGLHDRDIDQAFAIVAASSTAVSDARWGPGSGGPRDEPRFAELASTAVIAASVVSSATRRSRLVRGLVLSLLAALFGFAFCRALLALFLRLSQRRRRPCEGVLPAPSSTAATVPLAASTPARVREDATADVSLFRSGVDARTPGAARFAVAAAPEVCSARGSGGSDGLASSGGAAAAAAAASGDEDGGVSVLVDELRRALARLHAECLDGPLGQESAEWSEPLAEGNGDACSSASGVRHGGSSGSAKEALTPGACGARRSTGDAARGEAALLLSLRTLRVHVRSALGSPGHFGSPRINTSTVAFARVASQPVVDFLAALGASALPP